MILMHRIEPAKNMARYYAVVLTTNLFGEVGLVRIWGRIGRGGQRLTHWFESRPSAAEARRKLVRAKRRRGYQLIRARAA